MARGGRSVVPGAAVVAALTVAASSVTTSASTAVAINAASGWSINARHTNDAWATDVAPPLAVGWQRTDLVCPSYPVVGGGHVIVTEYDPNVGFPAIQALNARTGATQWGPFTLPFRPFGKPTGHVLDTGRVFVVDALGEDAAYDATSGALLLEPRRTPGVARRWCHRRPVSERSCCRLTGSSRRTTRARARSGGVSAPATRFSARRRS